jgi:hypothetical protein
MSKYEVGAKLSSTLLPLLMAVGLMVYFAALFHFTVVPGAIPTALRYLIMPAVFAFPWALLTFIFRERTVNAWNSMKAKTGIIPLRWRMFYGFNTLIVLSFFLFPFFSPPLAVFGAFVLAWRMVYQNEFISLKSAGVRTAYGLFLFVVLAAVPVFLLVFWFQNYFGYVLGQVLSTWFAWFDTIYFVSICIVDSLAVGALLHLSYGTLDATGKVSAEKFRIVWAIRFVEAVFGGILLVFLGPLDPLHLGLGSYDPLGLGFPLIMYINWACLGLVVLVYIVKLCVGLRGQANLSLLGVLLAAAFLLVQLLQTFNLFLKSVLIVGSSLLFVIAFLISFFASPDELVAESELEEPVEKAEDLAGFPNEAPAKS